MLEDVHCHEYPHRVRPGLHQGMGVLSRPVGVEVMEREAFEQGALQLLAESVFLGHCRSVLKQALAHVRLEARIV